MLYGPKDHIIPNQYYLKSFSATTFTDLATLAISKDFIFVLLFNLK